ncbi:MAG: hypothetical protein WBD87_05325 [Candidatus Acidiferrales bacterium]
MARIKFNELAKQTMTPESIARSRKAAIGEIVAMELSELRDALKVTQLDLAECMEVSKPQFQNPRKRNRNIHVDQLPSQFVHRNVGEVSSFSTRDIEDRSNLVEADTLTSQRVGLLLLLVQFGDSFHQSTVSILFEK